ncbi:hypothetical protein [Clostridium botulinum]|uniref:Uncharacterized protein n=1 Tax=Clostridium botulinum TaxID=1491 RepID=A0A9Q1UZC7_CLOBO|nr:hypothetical protein [Clostridium botulinum]AEB76809.1 putative hypothetical protein [Clostridium botulinum BKT015925]KEI02608.1 hypothetical protein Z953_06910 [Clostridium botulinum D str. 16868]KEI02687.1 hypothetical protein Y848_06820 [Clostridium botulinum C/D str. Sp77]KLU74738.1 hypothetical protein CBC3_12520 [Clostridium botulinum V891]KOA76942.1 hypothetical protein ADU78_05120 [Clostridium botulinum]
MKHFSKISSERKLMRKYRKRIIIGSTTLLILAVSIFSCGNIRRYPESNDIFKMNKWQNNQCLCNNQQYCNREEEKYISGPLGIDDLANIQESTENKESDKQKAIQLVKSIVGKDGNVVLSDSNYMVKGKKYYLVTVSFKNNKNMQYCIDKNDLKVFLVYGKGVLYPYGQSADKNINYGLQEY